MDILTIGDLEKMAPEYVFDKGVVVDGLEGINLANTGKIVKWVAVRGGIPKGGIPDWAIYCDNPFLPQPSFEEVARIGNKIIKDEHICKLVPCSCDALDVYRR